MSEETADSPVQYDPGTGDEGGRDATRPVWQSSSEHGGASGLHVSNGGAATLDTLQRSSCHLPLLMVVNTTMAGLVAGLAFVTLELVTHVLT